MDSWAALLRWSPTERITTVVSTGKTRQEQVATITSQGPEQATPRRVLESVLGHWSIENQSHWVRDVTFDEDRSRVRTNQGLHMMAILRNLAIAIIRLLGFHYVPTGLRYFVHPPRSLTLTGICFAPATC
ncbi:MAG: transposase [Candidatus Eisenbacteria sp.]|nr:transposase [Candidatus Eisenbacteria bacterium]